LAEKKQLRAVRFGKAGNEMTGSGAATTIDALEQLEVEKKKR